MNRPYESELKLIGEICDAIHARYPNMGIKKIPNERQPVSPKTELGVADICVASAYKYKAMLLAVVLTGVLTEEQRQMHEEARRDGYKVAVVSSVEEALKAVEQLIPRAIAIKGNEATVENSAFLKNTSEEERSRLIKSLLPQYYDIVMGDFQQIIDTDIKTNKKTKLMVDEFLLSTIEIIARSQGVSLTEAVEKVNRDPDRYLPRTKKVEMGVFYAYTTVMEDIKRRTDVVYGLLNQKTNDVMYPAVIIESAVLQVRMILELIALASLSLNKAAFEENRKKFEKHWHPKDILNDLKKKNPNFYPLPKPMRMPSRDRQAKSDVYVKTGFMGCEELIKIHGECGNILHAKNPFKENSDYGHYENEIRRWMKQIIELLNLHEIMLLGSDSLYVVQMMGKGDRVRMYEFVPVRPPFAQD